MSVIDFPNNPSVGTLYTFGTQQYVWSGVTWNLVVTQVIGPTGPLGPTGPASTVLGPTGPTGPQGVPTTIKGQYDTLAQLTSAQPVGQIGDAYLLADGTLMVWVQSTLSWTNRGVIIGPTGPQGLVGPTGPQGLIGPTGSGGGGGGGGFAAAWWLSQ